MTDDAPMTRPADRVSEGEARRLVELASEATPGEWFLEHDDDWSEVKP